MRPCWDPLAQKGTGSTPSESHGKSSQSSSSGAERAQLSLEPRGVRLAQETFMV